MIIFKCKLELDVKYNQNKYMINILLFHYIFLSFAEKVLACIYQFCKGFCFITI